MATHAFKRLEETSRPARVQADRPASPPPSRKGKEKAMEDAPASLLHRLAGPSTGKAGLGFRDPAEVERIIYESAASKWLGRPSRS